MARFIVETTTTVEEHEGDAFSEEGSLIALLNGGDIAAVFNLNHFISAVRVENEE
jgi:hypothetical protein